MKTKVAIISGYLLRSMSRISSSQEGVDHSNGSAHPELTSKGPFLAIASRHLHKANPSPCALRFANFSNGAPTQGCTNLFIAGPPRAYKQRAVPRYSITTSERGNSLALRRTVRQFPRTYFVPRNSRIRSWPNDEMLKLATFDSK